MRDLFAYKSESLRVVSLHFLAASHHLHLLGPPGLQAADGVRPGPVRGPSGAPGVQPAAALPAGDCQCPARRQGRQQAEPAPSPLLLPLHCLHPHHQGTALRPAPPPPSHAERMQRQGRRAGNPSRGTEVTCLGGEGVWPRRILPRSSTHTSFLVSTGESPRVRDVSFLMTTAVSEPADHSLIQS